MALNAYPVYLTNLVEATYTYSGTATSNIIKVFNGGLTDNPYSGMILGRSGGVANSYMLLTVTEKVNMHVYKSVNYSDEGGVSNKALLLYELVSGVYQLKETIPTSGYTLNTWYNMVELPPGQYKFTANGNYVVFSEWFIEQSKKVFFDNNVIILNENKLKLEYDLRMITNISITEIVLNITQNFFKPDGITLITTVDLTIDRPNTTVDLGII